MISSHDVNCDAEYTVWVEDLKRSYRMAQVNTVLKTNWAMKRWYSFYADKFQDEKLVRCVQELYNSGNLPITSGVIPFPEMFGLIPWGHHLDVVRLSNTLPEAVFWKKIAELAIIL